MIGRKGKSVSTGLPTLHSKVGPPDPRTANLIIAALPAVESEQVLAQSERIALTTRRVISERTRPLKHVYFPCSGVVSLVTCMMDGSTVEMATIGREGAVGMPMAIMKAAGADAFVQVPGEGIRVPTDRFLDLLSNSRRLPEVMQQFQGALFQLVGQNAACNRLHGTDQRLSRWLLMVQDRMGSAEYPLTHEFLATMLGVRRASVSEAAEKSLARGLIDYKRGKVTITDRPKLEESACECYYLIREVFEGLYA